MVIGSPRSPCNCRPFNLHPFTGYPLNHFSGCRLNGGSCYTILKKYLNHLNFASFMSTLDSHTQHDDSSKVETASYQRHLFYIYLLRYNIFSFTLQRGEIPFLLLFQWDFWNIHILSTATWRYYLVKLMLYKIRLLIWFPTIVSNKA